MRTTKPLVGGLALTLCFVVSSFAFAPIDGTFSYQGRLTDAGSPVTGSADLRFRLYDASAGGNQIGSQIDLSGVGVTGGLFNVSLDFGVDALNGDERWLEIEARTPVGSGSYTTLSPRQPLLGTPYAIQTRGIFVDDTENVGIGTDQPAADLHVEASEPVLRVGATGATPSSQARIELKGGLFPSIFSPLGTINFLDENDTLRAFISGSEVGGSVAQMLLNVSPGEVSQLSIFSTGIQVGDELELIRRSDSSTAALISSDGDDSYFQLQGGRIGVGTDTPVALIHADTSNDNASIAVYGVIEDPAGKAVQGFNSARADSRSE